MNQGSKDTSNRRMRKTAGVSYFLLFSLLGASMGALHVFISSYFFPDGLLINLLAIIALPFFTVNVPVSQALIHRKPSRGCKIVAYLFLALVGGYACLGIIALLMEGRNNIPLTVKAQEELSIVWLIEGATIVSVIIALFCNAYKKPLFSMGKNFESSRTKEISSKNDALWDQINNEHPVPFGCSSLSYYFLAALSCWGIWFWEPLWWLPLSVFAIIFIAQHIASIIIAIEPPINPYHFEIVCTIFSGIATIVSLLLTLALSIYWVFF